MTYVVLSNGRTVEVRNIIAMFAIEMEEEMRKKDNKYNESHRSNINFLIDHLNEERKEVDHEIKLGNVLNEKLSNYDTKVELVHEAIMCMLVHNII